MNKRKVYRIVDSVESVEESRAGYVFCFLKLGTSIRYKSTNNKIGVSL